MLDYCKLAEDRYVSERNAGQEGSFHDLIPKANESVRLSPWEYRSF
jgi:hypothetical protein